MGFINWHNLVNKKSHMVNLVSVILPDKIKSQSRFVEFNFVLSIIVQSERNVIVKQYAIQNVLDNILGSKILIRKCDLHQINTLNICV